MATKSKTFKILTFNAGLLDVDVFGKHILEPAPYVRERLLEIPKNLIKTCADIIALQEVYEQEHRNYLISKLKKYYPYHFYSRQKRIFRLENGLMYFSKNPFISKKVIPFKKETIEEEIFVFKGLAEGTLNNDLFGKITFFNVHTTAGGIRDPQNKVIENIRFTQIEQIIKCVRNTRVSDVQIILGDINAGPEVSTNNYDLFKKNNFLDVYLLKHPKSVNKKTWDPKNLLNLGGFHKNCPSQRIDHIFIEEKDLSFLKIKKADIVFDSECVNVGERKKVTISDHYGLLVTIESIKK